MALKMIYKGFEFEGDKDELIALMEELQEGTAPAPNIPLPPSKPSAASWRWTEEAVEKMFNMLYEGKLEVIKAFKKSRVLKYHELCKLSGLRGQELSARLAAITKNSQKAVGHDEAWLIDHEWTVPYDREQRNYFIHPEAYPYLARLL
jgi:hypothetical protein